jgi:hypothetical protein
MTRKRQNPEPMIPVVLSEEGLADERKFVMQDEWFKEQHIRQADGSIKVVLPKPTFTVQEVAKAFFGVDPEWLRYRLGNERPNDPDNYARSMFYLDGELVGDRRTPSGFRYFTLADIEKMGHSLVQQGAMSAGRLGHVVMIIKYVAKMWQII